MIIEPPAKDPVLVQMECVLSALEACGCRGFSVASGLVYDHCESASLRLSKPMLLSSAVCSGL